MVITVTPPRTTPKQRSLQNQKRQPLLPSGSDNAPPRGREFTSRSLSLRNSASSSSSSSSSTITSGGSISSGRSQSPVVNIRAIVSTPTSQNRTESTKRRSETTKPSTTGRMSVTSARSLLVSFQGESYSLPVNKVKPPPTTVGTPTGFRKSTPERRKEGGPTRVGDRKERDREISRSSDQQQHRWPGRLRTEKSSFISRRTNLSAERVQSNGSSSTLKEFGRLKSDENSRNDIGAKSSFRYESSRTIGSSKLIGATVRTGSPSRALISSTSNLFCGVASPSDRSGIGILMNGNNNALKLSEYSFAVDIRRRKLRETEIADVHSMRLLYNRLLQWRLANAKVENSLLVQTDTAEKSLCNAWIATTQLRRSYGSKRIELQSLRSSLKLYSILKEHEPHLKCWGHLDRDHCNSISSAINALEATVIRLPIVGGAKADLREVQEAISSALDITQATTSPIFSFLAKVEQMKALLSELSNLSVQEHHLLDDCKDFLSTLVPLQVMHWSLMTHFLQVQQEYLSIGKKL